MKKVSFVQTFTTLMLVCLVVLKSITANAMPIITTLSPTSGAVGAAVTITGTNFTTTAANNIFFFGTINATVWAATATSLTVTLPTGATLASIMVFSIATTLADYFTSFFNPTCSSNKGAITKGDINAKQDFTTASDLDSLTIGVVHNSINKIYMQQNHFKIVSHLVRI